MKIFIKILIYLNLLFFSINSIANHSLYGRINISGNYSDTENITDLGTPNEFSSSTTMGNLVSNASRFGIKGEFNIKDNLVGIYQAEYEAIVLEEEVYGNLYNIPGEETFKQRNTFIGIQGNFGTIRLGTYDSPLKLAQLDVDLFNDLIGDIKNITAGENRNKSSIGYDSPFLTEGLKIHLSFNREGYSTTTVITRDENGVVTGSYTDPYMSPLGEFQYPLGGVSYSRGLKNLGTGKSLSLKYDNEKIKLAVAAERGSKMGLDHNRLGMMIPSGPVMIGLIYTTSKSSNYEEFRYPFDYDAVTLSLKGNLPDQKGELKFQYSDSNAYKNFNRIQLGYDYKFSKDFKVFGFYLRSSRNSEGRVLVNPFGGATPSESSYKSYYFGIGLEYKFSYLFGN